MEPIMRRWLLILFLFSLGIPRAISADTLSLENRVAERTLSNGIKVLVLERHFSPTVAIRMMFRTGSVDEESGKTGLAHMFEHMMFKGTKTLGTKDYQAEAPLLAQIDETHRALDLEKAKGKTSDQKRISDLLDEIRPLEAKANNLVMENELWNLYEKEGASNLNAATSHDYTQYIVDLPSNKLQLWAILDSDRIKNPVFRQFYQEREVVKEERRMRVDTSPEGKLFEDFLSTAFQAHPYRNPTIGWEADLDHLYVSDLQDFYRRFYTPEALTIAVVGDVKPSEVFSMAEQYFGDWRVPASPRRVPTAEPPQQSPRRVVTRFDAQPHVLVGYHIPAYPDRDQVVSYAMTYLLAHGTTSRLYKALVEKKKVAASIDAGQDYPGERYPSLLIVSAATRFPRTNDDVLAVITRELDRLKKEPIEAWEIEKIRAGVEVGMLDTLQTNSGMASTLAYNQSVFGDWRFLLDFQKRIRELTAEDLQHFAQKYFTDDNKTVAVLEPVKKP
jgi:predicted Zn-dependent peptidase